MSNINGKKLLFESPSFNSQKKQPMVCKMNKNKSVNNIIYDEIKGSSLINGPFYENQQNMIDTIFYRYSDIGNIKNKNTNKEKFNEWFCRYKNILQILNNKNDSNNIIN